MEILHVVVILLIHILFLLFFLRFALGCCVFEGVLLQFLLLLNVKDYSIARLRFQHETTFELIASILRFGILFWFFFRHFCSIWLFLIVDEHVFAFGFPWSQILIKLLFKFIKLIQEIISLAYSEVVWLISIALPSFLIGVLAWARLILYSCAWSTRPSTAPARPAFGIYGKAASIIFSVEKLELFGFLVLFLLLIFLGFTIILLTKVLSLIVQYALLHLLLGEPFVFLYHHQQLGLVHKIKWFIDVLAWVLDVVLSYLVCFLVHFGFGLVLSCKNHLRWLLAVFLGVFTRNVGANFLGWTAARSFIRFGFRMLGVTSGHVDNRWCSKVQNWIVFHNLTTCSLFQAETWKLPSIGASTRACLPCISFFRQRPLQFLAIIGVSRILLAVLLVLICAMVKRFDGVLMLRL